MLLQRDLIAFMTEKRGEENGLDANRVIINKFCNPRE